MDPLAARPAHLPEAPNQAPDLAHLVRQLLGGQVRADGPRDQQRCVTELRTAFAAAPGEVRRQAFDDVFTALQRFNVPKGFAQSLAKDFVQQHAAQRLASYDTQIHLTADPWRRGQLNAQCQVLARYVATTQRLAAPVAPAAAANHPRMPEPNVAARGPGPSPGDFVPRRRAPLPPGAAPLPPRPNGPRRSQEPPAQDAPLRFPEPRAYVQHAPLKQPQHQHLEALSPGDIAAHVDDLVEGGPRLPEAALNGLLAQLQRGDLPTGMHARAYTRLERAARQQKFDGSAAAAVDQFLALAATAQLERLQALAQARHAGADIGNLDLVQAVAGLLRNERLPEAAAVEAAELQSELEASRTLRANAPNKASTKPNAALQKIAGAVALSEVSKRKTGAVLAPRASYGEVRISTLNGTDGTLLAHVASTAGRGTFAKFKPVVLADGRVMAARMMRTNTKYIANNGSVNTSQTPAELYLAERQALQAAGSRFAPTQTLVDAKGRIYDIVELTEGDAGALTQGLTLQQRARALPVALQDLLRDLDRLEEQQLAHRDIKPGNVMWLRDGTFGLGDYGLAHQGPVVGTRGTPGFLAPELLDGSADGRGKVDAYALGLTLVEMLLDREGMRGFPLKLHDYGPNGPSPAAQAHNMRQVHAEWVQARRSVPASAMGPQARRLDLAYQQMAEVEPNIADLVFVQLLHTQPAARPTAKEALRQLNRQVPASLFSRRRVAADLQAVSESSPYNQRVRESVALLQAEHARAVR